MTAVAFRAGILATDSAVWGGLNSNTIVGHRRKIHRLPDGGMIAGCGRSVDLDRVAKYLIEHGHFDGLSKLDDNQFNAIWVKPDGTAWWVENDFHPLIIEAPFAVCGASEVFMLGALNAGATAEEAVRLAIRETDGAAGEVQVERIHPVIAKATEYKIEGNRHEVAQYSCHHAHPLPSPDRLRHRSDAPHAYLSPGGRT